MDGDHETLVLFSADQSRPHVAIRLLDGVNLVGRTSNCEIILTSDTVSRRHAELIVNHGRLKVRDLNSKNGTFVQDRRVQEASVRVGERITFGSVAFVVQNVPAPDAGSSDEETARMPDSPVRSPTAIRDSLTPAQKRVFELLIKGKTEKDIAGILELSPHTIHSHVKDIYVAFGVHSRAELLANALK